MRRAQAAMQKDGDDIDMDDGSAGGGGMGGLMGRFM